ncbi:hypothetical protein E2320_001513 [Naja naja]|nr:hypothetical protein E2320_001513 [Naja naja]
MMPDVHTTTVCSDSGEDAAPSGVQTSMEPVIPSRSSIKLDLIMETANKLWVLDISMVASYQMEETWGIKTAKYGRPDHVADIHSWAAVPDSTPISTCQSLFPTECSSTNH